MGFVGPNGAGKSTTIRLALGLLDARRRRGARCSAIGCPMRRRSRSATSATCPTRCACFRNATLGWHMRFIASIYPGWDEHVRAHAAQALQPARRTDRQAAFRSGEQMKAVLLLALARRPRLLILDEPTAGLRPGRAPRSAERIHGRAARREPLDPLLLAQHASTSSGSPTASRSSTAAGWSTAATRRIFSSAGAASRCSCRPGATLPELPHVVSRVIDGQFVTLTTNQFSDDTLARLGGTVREVHRMSLEEIFVANVMHHREARGQ